MENAIGNLPSLDPEIYDLPYEEQMKIFPEFEKKKEEGLVVSKWHYPPKHVYRQVYSLMHTPTGDTAFNNIDLFKPKKKMEHLLKVLKTHIRGKNGISQHLQLLCLIELLDPKIMFTQVDI